MIQNRIVARFADGRTLKGTTQDFAPTKEAFHVITSEGGARPFKVALADLKAVFFVKDLIGNAQYTDSKEFLRALPGKRLEVTFADGEVIVGATQAYQPDRTGFFLVPADPLSNNDRVFVVTKAVRSVSVIE
jgi:hypothetical protein